MKVTCPDNKGSYRHRSGPTFASSASGKEWRMTAQRKDAVATEDAWAGQNLAQFEPDPEGFDATVPPAEPAASADADAPWIVWPTSAEESAWAADELEMEWQAAAGLAGKGATASGPRR